MQIARQHIPSPRGNITSRWGSYFFPWDEHRSYVYKVLSSEWRLIRFCGPNKNDVICRFFSSAEPWGFAEVGIETMSW